MMNRKRKRCTDSRRNNFRRLVGIESLESRRLLACVPGGDTNDQICEASSLSPGQTKNFTISSSTDVDMFELKTGTSAGTSRNFQFNVNTPSSDFDPFLRVFDSEGNPVLNGGVPVENDDANGTDSQIAIFLPSLGTYYLGVSAFTNTNYDAENGSGDNPSSSPNVSGSYSITSTDNNDVINEALPILVGQTRTGFSINHDLDVDMFEVEITQEGAEDLDFTFVMEATSSSSLDPFLRLFNASGTELESANNAIGTSRATINHTFSTPGTYYLGTSSDENEDYNASSGQDDEEGNSSGGFTLSVSDNNDEISEVDGSASMLLGTSVGSFTRFGDINLGTDVDLFKIDGINGQAVKLTVQPSVGNLTPVLRMFDDSGNELNGTTAFETGNQVSKIFRFNDNDDFYIGISSLGNAAYDADDGTGDSNGSTQGQYAISAVEVSLDDNDRISGAFSVVMPQPYALDGQVAPLSSGYIPGTIDVANDVDMFKFTLAQTTYVHIDVDRSNGLDTFLRIFNSDGSPSISSEGPVENDDDNAPGETGLNPLDSYLLLLLPSGTYYAGVSGFGNQNYDAVTGLGDSEGSTGSYTINIRDGLMVTTNADTTNTDDGDTSLRDAIDVAQFDTGLVAPSLIEFSDRLFNEGTVSQTISLDDQLITSDQLSITTPLVINGPGADLLSISANDAGRVLLIDNDNDSTAIDVTIRGVTIRDGNTSARGLIAEAPGAGIKNTENLTLDRVEFIANRSDEATNLGVFSDGGDGGGLHHALGSLTVVDSLFVDNSSAEGGGINVASGTAKIINTTFSGNRARSSGGGVHATDAATVTIVNSTIVGNRANHADFFTVTEQGGGLRSHSSLTLHNTIIAGNVSGSETNSIIDDTLGFFEPGSSNNLVAEGRFTSSLDPDLNINGDSFGAPIAVDSILNTTLANNGGPTRTHELVIGSRAINGGQNSVIPAGVSTDQRGEPRIQLGNVDIGAYESGFEAASTLVTTLDDVTDETDGLTSLREAISFAFSGQNSIFVSFDEALSASPYTVSVVAPLLITKKLSIRGAGADITTINGSTFGTRTFDIDDGDDANQIEVSLGNLTISGLSPNTGLPSGAGIQNRENLSIRRVAITGTRSDLSGGSGILHDVGHLRIQSSTIEGNVAITNTVGGGIRVASGTAQIVNSTIAGNSAGQGGGLFVSGATEIANTTIAQNNVLTGSTSADGPGIFVDTPDLILHNTIVTDAIASQSLNSASTHNLIADASAFSGGITDGVNGNIVGNDGSGLIPIGSILSTLQPADNGGPTKTFALRTGSLALNAGDDTKAIDLFNALGPRPLRVDQRDTGFDRFFGTVDIGAFEVQSIDYGDAPDTYGTTIANNGASHGADGPRLGNLRDVESNGIPSVLADSDDTTGTDDDDGVLFGRITPGSQAGINIDLQDAAGRLDAWIDFNQDGVWDAGEQILDDVAVSTGLQTLNYTVPAGLTGGVTFARVRVSTAGGLAPTGAAADGEVEDYAVTIGSGSGVASATINGGRATRSEITSIEVDFGSHVDAVASDFLLTNTSTGQNLTGISVFNNGSGISTLTFTPVQTGNSGLITGNNPGVLPTLADGAYQLHYRPVLNASGTPTNGEVSIDNFFRKYGETDATSATVGLTDFAAFRSTFGEQLGEAGYRSDLDADRNGSIGLTDFAAFRSGFGN